MRDAGETHVHRLLGLAYAHLGRDADAERHLLRALDLATDPVRRANTHHNLTWLLSRVGRTPDALEHAQSALALYRAAGHRAGQARMLNAVGWLRTTLGDHREAISDCRRALAVLEELDDRPGQANTWDTLGYAQHHLGEYDEAADRLRARLATR